LFLRSVECLHRLDLTGSESFVVAEGRVNPEAVFGVMPMRQGLSCEDSGLVRWL
jgi:hypothetical protein